MSHTNCWRLSWALLLSVLFLGGGVTACKRDNADDNKKSDPVAKGKTGDPGKKDPNFKPNQKADPKPAFPVSDLKTTDAVELPFILWGGDVATFHANGGEETKPGTIFANHGLKFKLKRHPGDDFDLQVKNYADGTSPFLRGTMSMVAQWAEQLGSDPRTKPVVFLQLTWSAGDHLVARSDIKTLADLRGKTIALQDGGPHVGMLYDILKTAGLDRYKDVTIVTTKDITGKGKDCPAEVFRKNDKIDACFVITPDMMDLTGATEGGQIDKRGDGTKDSVKGAHVLVSTAHMSRSIADVYACRNDYYQKHRDKVDKFAAGYLKACEELLAMKKAKGAPYETVKKMTQNIFGKEDIESLDAAGGLIDDATFVGLPGNIRFFTDAGNLSGFRAKQQAALDAAHAEGNIAKKTEFIKADLNYEQIRQLGQLASKVSLEPRFRKLKALPTKDDAIFSFTIGFDVDQAVFSEQQYGQQFQRTLEMASLFGNARIYIRGHADPTLFLKNVLAEGISARVLTSAARDGSADVFLKNGPKLPMSDMKQVVDVVEKNSDFVNARRQLQDLKTLSNKRANTVNQSVVDYARGKGYVFDTSQIDFEGVGVFEPVVGRINATAAEAESNRRVEFRIVRIPIGELPPDDDGFDR